eukprot:s2943_g2.t1
MGQFMMVFSAPQEVRPLLVRYVFRDCELQSACRSHDEGPQKQEMLEGIGRYHQQMRDENPTLGSRKIPPSASSLTHLDQLLRQWFRQLLEQLPSADVTEGLGPGARRLGAYELKEVADRNPRAFLVISPLLSKPELLEKVVNCSWTEIKEQLQDELASLIRRESDVWRGFLERHADMVSKESLKIIQKVLKSCVPGSGLGEFTLRFAEDVDEANEARELAEMRFAEAEQRWDMSAQLAVAEVEGKRLESEKKVKKLSSLEQRLKIRVKLQALRLKANTSRVLEEEREAAEERLETLQKDHRNEKSRLQKDLEDIRSALGREEVRCTQLREEATLLEDSKQELLQAIAKLDAEERKDRRHWRTKNAVLKHHLKQSQLQQKELVAKMKAEAEARLAEVQAAMSQEATQLRKELEEAQKAQRSSFAQLEVQTAALQRTGQLNTELRTSTAKAEEDARCAQEAAAAAIASKEETKCQVQTLQQELKLAEELCRCAEAKQKEANTLQLEAEQRAAEAEKAYVAVEERELRAKAELKSQSQEAHRLTERCALLSQDKAELEQKVQQKQISQEQAEQTLMAKQAELDVLQETLKTLQDSNRTLRDERAAAYAASEEALRLSTEAQALVETAKSQRLKAEAEAAESRKQAAVAEEKLNEAARRLAEFETERQSWTSQVSKLRRSCAVKEAEVAKAKDDERKAAMKFTAQAQEALRLSASCADLKGQLCTWRSAAEAATSRAEQAEAERAVALSASELSEEDVRRLVKEGPTKPMSAPESAPDPLIEDLEKLFQAESSPEKADPVEEPVVEAPKAVEPAEPAEPAEVLEAPSKKQRLEEGDAGVTSVAVPLRRIRFKSSGGLLTDTLVARAGIEAFGSVEAAQEAVMRSEYMLSKSESYYRGDLNESYLVLTPNEDPSVAEDCHTTFQNDTYGFRSWASGGNSSRTQGPDWSTRSKRQLLEIGSNVGCWSLYAAKVMKMEVLAVEPNKFAAFFLHYNIALNQLQSQVTVLHGALVPTLPGVPDSERSVTHQFCNPGLGDLQEGEIYDPLDPCNEKEDVVGYTLEALLLRLHNVSILKMNCEGCEVWTLPDVDSSLLKQISRTSLEIFEEKPRDSKFLGHPKTPHLLELMCTDLIWPADRRVAALGVCSATEVSHEVSSRMVT